MFKRTSHVSTIQVNSIINSSILQIGDSKEISADTKSLALLREIPIFWDFEGDFQKFPIFTRPTSLPFRDETVYVKTINETGKIHVSNIHITGISTSSLLHVGSTNHVYLENRRKHIRHLVLEHLYRK